MYCKHCGKQLSDEAFMCPECGAPTGVKPPVPIEPPKDERTTPTAHNTPLGIIGFVLSTFAFVTGIIFGAFLFVFSGAVLLLYVLSATTILPGLVGICLGISALKNETGIAKILALTGIILAAFALLFMFIGGCVLVTTL